VPLMRTAPAATAFRREGDGYLRPLVLLSYAAQARLGLDTPAALHGANIAVHALNGVLLFLLCVGLGVPASVAAAGTAVFSAHPLASAAVAYVSGRTDLLAACFMLMALLVAHRARRRSALDAANVRARVVLETLRITGVVVLVACAALSKESGLLAGVLVAGVWWLEERRVTARPTAAPSLARGRLALPAAAMVTSFVLAVLVAPPGLGNAARIDLDARMRAVGAALSTYARLAIMPSGLHLDRLTEVAGGYDAWIGGASAVAIGIIIAVFVWRPSRLRFALVALVLLALPASNLLPIYPAIAERWVFTGEQLAYLPLAPLAILAACALAAVVGRAARSVRVRDVAVLATAAVVVAASVAPVRARQAELADPVAVYRNTLAHSPSPRACFNLGVALLTGGKAAEAASVYERCARISPHDAGIYVQLGVAYQRSGERNKAEISYAKALELDPEDPYAWSNYASLDATAGSYAEARQKWQRALALAPGFAPAIEGLRKLDSISREQRAPLPPS